MPAFGGCFIPLRCRRLHPVGGRHRADWNGVRRRKGVGATQAQRRVRDRSGRGDQRGLGHARRRGGHQPGRRDPAAGTHRADRRLAAGDWYHAMQLRPAAFDEIRKAVHDLCGIVIAEDKQYLVKSRLEPVLRRNGLPSYEALVQRLREPNALLLQDQTVEAITTKETSFNRDGHPFEELRRSILPELASLLIRRKPAPGSSYPRARIWCAAAATGQEAYSVAMAVTDFLAARPARGLTVEDFPI